MLWFQHWDSFKSSSFKRNRVVNTLCDISSDLLPHQHSLFLIERWRSRNERLCAYIHYQKNHLPHPFQQCKYSKNLLSKPLHQKNAVCQKKCLTTKMGLFSIVFSDQRNKKRQEAIFGFTFIQDGMQKNVDFWQYFHYLHHQLFNVMKKFFKILLQQLL